MMKLLKRLRKKLSALIAQNRKAPYPNLRQATDDQLFGIMMSSIWFNTDVRQASVDEMQRRQRVRYSYQQSKASRSYR